MSTEFRSRYREEEQKEYDPRDSIGGTKINGHHKAMLERMGSDPNYAVDNHEQRGNAWKLATDIRREARTLNGEGKSGLEPGEKQELDFRLQLLAEQYSAGKFNPDHPATIAWERDHWKSALTLMEKANPDYGEQWITGIREKLNDVNHSGSNGISHELTDFKADYKNQGIGNSVMTERQREALDALVNPGVEANDPFIQTHLRDLAFNIRGEARQAAWENPGILPDREALELDQKLLNLYRRHEFSEGMDNSWESRGQEAHDWKQVLETMEKIHPEYREDWAVQTQEKLESGRESSTLQDWSRNIGETLTNLKNTLTGRDMYPGGAGEYGPVDPEDHPIGNTVITLTDLMAFEAITNGEYDPETHRESLKSLAVGLHQHVAERNEEGAATHTIGLEETLETLSQQYRNNPGAAGEGREYETQLWVLTLDQAASTLPGYDLPWVKDLANNLWSTYEELWRDRESAGQETPGQGTATAHGGPPPPTGNPPPPTGNPRHRELRQPPG